MNIKCVLFSLQLLSETFPTVRRTAQDIITYVPISSCKVPISFARF